MKIDLIDEIDNNSNREFIYTIDKILNHNNNEIKEYKKKKKFVIISIIICSILIIIGGIIYYLISKKEKKEADELENDDLIININYKTDILYKYENNKVFKMKGENKFRENNSTKEMMHLADIFFIIRKHFRERNYITNKAKNRYSGFLGILNLKIQNESNNIQVIYDKQLDKIFNINNNEYKNDPNLTYFEEKGNLCFAKIDFYENGEIISISYPINNFNLSYMEYIKEYAELIIPKISSSLYTDNINNTINQLLSDDKNNSASNNLRELNKIKRQNKNIKKRIGRILTNESSQDFEIEEYLTVSESKPLNLELREKQNCSNCSEQKLTEISINNVRNEEIDMDESSLNKTIFRTINKDGIIESITELEKLILKNGNDNEDLDYLNESNTDTDMLNDNDENDDILLKMKPITQIQMIIIFLLI